MGVIPSEEEFCEERFLGNYGAAQAKQQNGQTVHYKHEYVRACLGKRGEFPSSDTLGWPSDAARIRDHYISILSTVNREERRTPKERKVHLFRPSAKVLLHQYKAFNEFSK